MGRPLYNIYNPPGVDAGACAFRACPAVACSVKTAQRTGVVPSQPRLKSQRNVLHLGAFVPSIATSVAWLDGWMARQWRDVPNVLSIARFQSPDTQARVRIHKRSERRRTPRAPQTRGSSACQSASPRNTASPPLQPRPTLHKPPRSACGPVPASTGGVRLLVSATPTPLWEGAGGRKRRPRGACDARGRVGVS